MLRRNIDITLGLVNGAIGTVRSVKYSIDKAGVVESISVDFSDDKLHQLTRVKSKFQVLEKAYVCYLATFPNHYCLQYYHTQVAELDASQCCF